MRPVAPWVLLWLDHLHFKVRSFVNLSLHFVKIDANAKKSGEGEALNKGRDLVSCSESEKMCFPVTCNYRAVTRLWFYTLSSNSFRHNCKRAYFDVTHANLNLIRQPIVKVVLHEILLLEVSCHDNCCIHRLRCKTGVFIILPVLKR